MINGRDFENAKRLAGALERRSEGADLQRLASALNYLPDQLQVDILSLCRIVADSDKICEDCPLVISLRER